jgi:predicted amidophosphoribosyltransferase
MLRFSFFILAQGAAFVPVPSWLKAQPSRQFHHSTILCRTKAPILKTDG